MFSTMTSPRVLTRSKSSARSMAVAARLEMVTSSCRSSSVKTLGREEAQDSTPTTVSPRKMGATRAEATFLRALGKTAKRGSAATSLTMMGFPSLATQPMKPSPSSISICPSPFTRSGEPETLTTRVLAPMLTRRMELMSVENTSSVDSRMLVRVLSRSRERESDWLIS